MQFTIMPNGKGKILFENGEEQKTFTEAFLGERYYLVQPSEYDRLLELTDERPMIVLSENVLELIINDPNLKHLRKDYNHAYDSKTS